MWIILFLCEIAYILFSTVISIKYKFDPMIGELLRTIVRIISLMLYVLLFYKKLVPKRIKHKSSNRERTRVFIATIMIMLYPLLFEKAGFTNFLQLLWILTSFIVGFREEIFYRGFIQNKLSSKYGIISTIIITSLIFTLYHVVYFIWGQWITLIQVFLWSVFIGILYYKTKSIFIVSIIHGIYDAIPFITPIQLNTVPYYYGLFFIGLSVLILLPMIEENRKESRHYASQVK